LRDSLLGAYVAEHSQLLLVISTHVFFLTGWPVETREFLVPTGLPILGMLRGTGSLTRRAHGTPNGVVHCALC
jgi:hypothetical protein